MKQSSDSQLKAKREVLSLSIDDAHAALNINKDYLEMLEDPEKGVSALSQVIAPVYAHGYYRIYRQYLGLERKDPPLSVVIDEQPQIFRASPQSFGEPAASFKEESAVSKIIPAVCALVVLMTILVLSR